MTSSKKKNRLNNLTKKGHVRIRSFWNDLPSWPILSFVANIVA